jgi:hypothetical protein
VQQGRKWLVIAIPTIPRQQHYLTNTLSMIAQQLPVDTADPFFEQACACAGSCAAAATVHAAV